MPLLIQGVACCSIDRLSSIRLPQAGEDDVPQSPVRQLQGTRWPQPPQWWSDASMFYEDLSRLSTPTTRRDDIRPRPEQSAIRMLSVAV
ncbi:hypothetical protein [Actinacidiphila glaucinigra]|uniref:hypothetical protein n=1 Tax=Actinacidiphila glaucinigra TaxID=235986 RepID=UPI00117CED5A|nr:hypothetical protein [Actinacidiphila glaucinigra]